MLARYEIRIGGRLDERATAAFAGLDVADRGSVTVIRGEFDQAGLHGVLERIRFLGLDLVEVRRVRGSPAGGDDSITSDGDGGEQRNSPAVYEAKLAARRQARAV